MGNRSIIREVPIGPRDVSVSLVGGQDVVSTREVELSITSWDYLSGERNVKWMKVWGDIDPALDGRITAQEWMPFVPRFDIVLSAGDGTKEVSVLLADTSLAEASDPVVIQIEYAASAPHTSILWSTPRKRHLQGATTEVHWSASHAFTAYKVCATASPISTISGGLVLVEDVGSWAAGETMKSSIDLFGVWDAEWPLIAAADRHLAIFVKVGADWY